MFTNTIDPVLFSFGFLTIRWYGIFLGLGVALGLLLLARMAKKENKNIDEILSFALWLILGGLIGARLGHIVFYNLDFFLLNPLEIIMVNHGGLSSHGMAVGLIVALIILISAKKLAWREFIDLLVIPIPLIAGFIRIGNFFNSEIVGKASTLPWSVKFPLYEFNPIFRHPSQIYEAVIAFLILGFMLLIHSRYSKRLAKTDVTFIFISLYFFSRFLIEFVKEYPTYAGLSMGQWLSIPFILTSTIWLLSKSQKLWLKNH